MNTEQINIPDKQLLMRAIMSDTTAATKHARTTTHQHKLSPSLITFYSKQLSSSKRLYWVLF